MESELDKGTTISVLFDAGAYGFVLEDLLTDCEHTADHCPNVAVEMLQATEGKLEAHEYLNALKVGDL